EPGMVDCASWLDQLFGPGDGLVVFDHEVKERRVGGDGGGIVEVAAVGNPSKRGAQIGCSAVNQSYASRWRGLSHSDKMSASRAAKTCHSS
ncbi:MAG: hypothetical protein ACXWD8_05330, partial [Mycobacterium sp.]